MGKKTFSNEELCNLSTYDDYRSTFGLNNWYRKVSEEKREEIYAKMNIHESDLPFAFAQSFKSGVFNTLSIHESTWDILVPTLEKALKGNALLASCYKEVGLSASEKNELVKLKEKATYLNYIAQDKNAPAKMVIKAKKELARIAELEETTTTEDFSNNGMILAIMLLLEKGKLIDNATLVANMEYIMKATSMKATWEKTLQNWVKKFPQDALSTLNDMGIIKDDKLYAQYVKATTEIVEKVPKKTETNQKSE